MKKPGRLPLHQTSDQGFALVFALLFMVTASGIVIAYSVAARIDAGFSRALFDDRVRQFQLSEAVSLIALVTAVQPNETRRRLQEEGRCSLPLAGNQAARIILQNHAGKIDLNAAGKELLALGFLALGKDSTTANNLADHVIAYRTATGGPNDPDISIAGGPKRALFDDVVELTDFALAQDVQPQRLSDVFTVKSRSGTVLLEAMVPALRQIVDEAAPYVVRNNPREPAIRLIVGLEQVHGSQSEIEATFSIDGSRPDGVRFAVPASYRPYGEVISPASEPTKHCVQWFGEDVVALLTKILS